MAQRYEKYRNYPLYANKEINNTKITLKAAEYLK
jgi:hypothetical protein